MKNLFKRKLDWILVILLIFVPGFLTAIVPQTRTGIVRIADEKGKSEDIKLYEASYALIIGASNYENGWRNLPGVKDDLIAVKAALTKQGFVVEELNAYRLGIHEISVVVHGRVRSPQGPALLPH